MGLKATGSSCFTAVLQPLVSSCPEACAVWTALAMSGAVEQSDGCQGMTYPEDAGELASSGWGCKESFLPLILYSCKRQDLREQGMTEGIWGLLIQQELLLGSGGFEVAAEPWEEEHRGGCLLA